MTSMQSQPRDVPEELLQKQVLTWLLQQPHHFPLLPDLIVTDRRHFETDRAGYRTSSSRVSIVSSV